MTNTTPWVEKYRPKTWEQLKGIPSAKLKQLHTIPGHLLFHGGPGTGKNSALAILFRQWYGTNVKKCTHYFNASQDRGIDFMRNRIKPLTQQVCIVDGVQVPHFIALDEADKLTESSQAALKRLMETCLATCRFAILCNRLSNILPAIRSRVDEFSFSSLSKDDVTAILQQICIEEKVRVENVNVLKHLADITEGDVRTAINRLHTAVHTSSAPLSIHWINWTCGNLQEEDWQKILSIQTQIEAYHFASQLDRQSLDFRIVLRTLQTKIFQLVGGDVLVKFLELTAQLEVDYLQQIPVKTLFQILLIEILSISLKV